MPSISNVLGQFFGCTRENAVATNPQTPPRTDSPARATSPVLLQRTAQAPAPAPIANEGNFNPRFEYTTHQLCRLGTERKYTAETLMQMLQEMNFRLSDPHLNRQVRTITST